MNIQRWKAISAMAGAVTAAGLAKLPRDPNVLQVDIDFPGGGGDAVSIVSTEAEPVQALGYSGKGVVVAGLDSGVDTSHPDLASAIVGEQCFCRNSNESGCCPDGGPSQSGPGSGRDDHSHGSNVTEIIASSGIIAPKGIAPETEIVAVRVMDSQSRFSSSAQVLSGLDRVITARPDVKVVNMSLGTDALYNGACDTQMSAFASAINAPRQSGVAVFACSMNNGNKTMMAAPACVSNTISVGSVNNSASPFDVNLTSNSGSNLDLLALGCPIVSTGRGGVTSAFCGTSQATPHASAGAALLFWLAEFEIS